MNYLVQPWLSEYGHPAQSLLNTCKALDGNIEYLVLGVIGRNRPSSMSEAGANKWQILPLPRWIEPILGTLAAGTLLSFWQARQWAGLRLFYLDANPYVLGFMTGLLGLSRWQRLDILLMVGPEFFQRTPMQAAIKWRLVRRLLREDRVHLHLRTEELARDWQTALPQYAHRMGPLPSLELFSIQQQACHKADSDEYHLALVGQIRPSKNALLIAQSLSALQKPFSFRVWGRFQDQQLASKLRHYDFVDVRDTFLEEGTMIDCLRWAHYQMMIYHPWDQRMESGLFYYGLAVGCPMICLAEGWLGRQVAEEGLGITLAEPTPECVTKALARLPQPSSKEYRQMLSNLEQARKARLQPQVINEFLGKIGWI